MSLRDECPAVQYTPVETAQRYGLVILLGAMSHLEIRLVVALDNPELQKSFTVRRDVVERALQFPFKHTSINPGRPGALLSSSVAFGSGCG